MSESALVRLYTYCPNCNRELPVFREGVPTANKATAWVDIVCECGWTGSVPIFVPLESLLPLETPPEATQHDEDKAPAHPKPRTVKKRR